MEITPKTILCVNLIDEAKRKKIEIDCPRLEELLGIPVIPTASRDKVGLNELKDSIHEVTIEKKRITPKQLAYNETIEASIAKIQPEVEALLQGQFNSRWVAMRLLDGDTTILTEILHYLQRLNRNPRQLIKNCGRLKCCE